MRTLWQISICATLIVAAQASAQVAPSVTFTLHNKDFDRGRDASLVVTADVPSTASHVRVRFITSKGISTQPSDLDFIPPGKQITVVSVHAAGDVPTGEYFIIAREVAELAGAPAPLIADQTITFTLQTRLSLLSYLLWGLAGFAIGYAIRIVMSVLKAIPPPNLVTLAVGGSPPDGKITVFIKNNYYKVDFTLSLVIAFIVLLYLLKDGRPPESASVWYGALLVGAGLGFLTNNDLLAKVKVP